MKPDQIVALAASLLKEAGHPEIADATALDHRAARIDLTDGSTNYVKVAHIQPATAPPPKQPSWPGYPTATDSRRAP